MVYFGNYKSLKKRWYFNGRSFITNSPENIKKNNYFMLALYLVYTGKQFFDKFRRSERKRWISFLSYYSTSLFCVHVQICDNIVFFLYFVLNLNLHAKKLTAFTKVPIFLKKMKKNDVFLIYPHFTLNFSRYWKVLIVKFCILLDK